MHEIVTERENQITGTSFLELLRECFDVETRDSFRVRQLGAMLRYRDAGPMHHDAVAGTMHPIGGSWSWLGGWAIVGHVTLLGGHVDRKYSSLRQAAVNILLF